MERIVYKFEGKDLEAFFQGLVTQNVQNLTLPTYCFMLTASGRFFCDFFIIPQNPFWFIEIDKIRAQEILKKLSLYKLRRDVTWTPLDLMVATSHFEQDGGYLDPRHALMGYRFHKRNGVIDSQYTKRRFSIGLAEDELIVEKSIVLEFNFDNFHAFSWNKGCYIGQELMARTKHLGEIRKSIFSIESQEISLSFGDIFTQTGKKIGKILSYNDRLGLAMLYKEHCHENLFLNNIQKVFIKNDLLV